MTTIARIPSKGSIEELTSAIKAADSLEDLTEARARIEALKAWSKVHGCAKGMRLDLLRIEVEALVRIIQLDGEDTLPTSDRKAACWLADMSPADRATLVSESATATTAVGMCKSVWREKEIAEQRQRNIFIGRHMAEEPTPPPTFDQRAILIAQEHAHSVAGVLAKLTDEYISNGVEFTIDELADEIISEAALSDDLSEDETINKGVREVCREAIRRTPPLTIDGTSIPRMITARNEDGKYIRIPTLNATVAHLNDMILMREEQLEQDRCAVERLRRFAKHLSEFPGGDQPESRIGKLIASSITQPAKD